MTTETKKVVPVICSECGHDGMTYEVTTEGDHQVCVWACPNCRWSEVTTRKRTVVEAFVCGKKLSGGRQVVGWIWS